MTKVPGAGNVERALRGVRRELKSSLRQINQQAAKLLSKGNYSGSQMLVDVARMVNGFEAEVEGLRGKWRTLRGSSGGSGHAAEQTPLWGYYKVILQTLMAAEGRATTTELITRLDPIVAKVFKAGDLETMSNGRTRWQVMIRRARRPMIKEGFIEADKGKEWHITSAGRKAAVGGGPTK